MFASFKKAETILLKDIEQIAQVAGHAGFYSSVKEPQKCLKTINMRCLRGRRENLFYQLIESIKANSMRNDTVPVSSLKPFIIHKQACTCEIDKQKLLELAEHVPVFYGLKYTDHTNLSDWNQFSDELCKCYSNSTKDAIKRNGDVPRSCSHDPFNGGTFLCLKNMTAHCKKPCIIDVKIGPITHDPMAPREKVLEQRGKYTNQLEFGFRILGIKAGRITKGKDFGKELECNEQVLAALNLYLSALGELERKSIVIKEIVRQLREIEDWFSNRNIGQLNFYSSSLLIVYDAFDVNSSENLKESVRVSMIDFAHVFHKHNDPPQPDENYLYGLRGLLSRFNQLHNVYQRGRYSSSSLTN